MSESAKKSTVFKTDKMCKKKKEYENSLKPLYMSKPFIVYLVLSSRLTKSSQLWSSHTQRITCRDLTPLPALLHKKRRKKERKAGSRGWNCTSKRSISLFPSVCVCTSVWLYTLLRFKKEKTTPSLWQQAEPQHTNTDGSMHKHPLTPPHIQVYNCPLTCTSALGRPFYLQRIQSTKRVNYFKDYSSWYNLGWYFCSFINHLYRLW